MSKRFHQVSVYRSADMGIAMMELASNHSFPRHTHDEYGIGVVLSGAQRSWSGVGAVESLPGDVITVNPGELHDGYSVRGHIRRWRIIYFDPKALQRLLADEGPETEFIYPSLRDAELGGQVNVLFDRLRNGADRLGVEEILARVVPRLASRRAGVIRAPAKHTAPVIKARARIEDDPSSLITLSELAQLAGMSRYQLLRAFAREFGTTPYAYVIQCRVRLCRRLLADGAMLADAAQLAGFADQSHMTRAFVRQYGVSPGLYKAAAN
jgi:AraC-like DNA-binding protein